MKHPLLTLASSALCCLLLLAGCGAPVYYLEVNGSLFEQNTFADVETGLRSLSGADDYLYLEPETPVKGSIYIETYMPYYDDGLGYIVEICMEDSLFGYRYYEARTTDIEEVVGCYSRYYKSRQLPNLNAWEDVTDYTDYYEDYDYYDYYGFQGPGAQPA